MRPQDKNELSGFFVLRAPGWLGLVHCCGLELAPAPEQQVLCGSSSQPEGQVRAERGSHQARGCNALPVLGDGIPGGLRMTTKQRRLLGEGVKAQWAGLCWRLGRGGHKTQAQEESTSCRWHGLLALRQWPCPQVGGNRGSPGSSWGASPPGSNSSQSYRLGWPRLPRTLPCLVR